MARYFADTIDPFADPNHATEEWGVYELSAPQKPVKRGLTREQAEREAEKLNEKREDA